MTETNTIEEKVLHYLVQKGMFAKQANAVLAMYKDKHPEMDGKWDCLVDDDPLRLIAALMIGINKTALKYIEENLPRAWYKSLFEN